MSEREFWIQVRRTCLALAAAIERRYDLRAGDYGPCAESDGLLLWERFIAPLTMIVGQMRR